MFRRNSIIVLTLLISHSFLNAAPLALQSDFGRKEDAVASMHGVALGVDPTLNITDISHEIPPFDIWVGAYVLNQTAPYWPVGTVFVSVVDPGVGTNRKSVVLKTKSGHYFVTPDNGTLTFVAKSMGIAAVREIDEAVNRRKGSEKSYTFHGRDVYAYTGAKLAAGKMPFENVGPELKPEVISLPYQEAKVSGNRVIGTIEILDFRYGNIWTNINRKDFAALEAKVGDNIGVTIRQGTTTVLAKNIPYQTTFGAVPEGEPLLYFNSLENVALALNMGSFAEAFGISYGSEWSLELGLVLDETSQVVPMPSQEKYGPQEFEGEGFTALVVAYAPEIKALLEAIEADPDASIRSEVYHKGVRYHIGSYNNHPLLIFATGISIPNAAMTMQMAIDYFPIDQVLYMGIAGGVNPELSPGDVVIPERWYYHDESVYANPDPAKPGEFILPDYYEGFLERHEKVKMVDPYRPDYDNFGYIFPDEVAVVKTGKEGDPHQMPYFNATPRLINAARDAVEDMEPFSILHEKEAVVTVGGNGVTGSVFLDNREYRKWVREVFKAEVTEMESAAVGHVCYVNDVDWIIIRALSDLAGGQEGKNVENIYDYPVSRGAAIVLFELMDELLN